MFTSVLFLSVGGSATLASVWAASPFFIFLSLFRNLSYLKNTRFLVSLLVEENTCLLLFTEAYIRATVIVNWKPPDCPFMYIIFKKCWYMYILTYSYLPALIFVVTTIFIALRVNFSQKFANVSVNISPQFVFIS